MTKEQEMLDQQDQVLDLEQAQELEEVVAESQDGVLEFEEATQMTVKDALHKEADLQAGITEEDSVLDRYIKKHRDEIGEQKFLNKVGDLDTEALDEFIQKQRAELAERKAELLAGAAFGTVAATAAASKLTKKAGDQAEQLVDTATETTQTRAAGLAETADKVVEAGKETAQAATEAVADQAKAVTAKGAALTTAAVATTTATSAATVAAEKSNTSFDALVANDRLLDDSSVLEDKPSKKNKFLVAGALGALFLGVAAAGYGLNYLNQSANQANNSGTETSTVASSSKETTSSSSQADSADLTAFNDLYKSFFADDDLTKPKNSEFDKLSDLEAALKALEGTADYDDAKSKVDSLIKTISAIQAINDKFETPAIVDGEKVEATLKEGASFDDLSSDVLNTGKASLDTLIQAVIAEGRGLLGTGGGSISGAAASTSEAAAATTEQAPAAEAGQVAQATETPVAQVETPVVTEQVTETVTPAQETVVTPSVAGGQVIYGGQAGQTVAVRTDLPAGHIQAPTNYGLINYDPSTLQRELSRVPFNFDVIADASNPAWTFNPGVMEEIIRVSQQRGYINGYEFILEPVNIINGNGYYNMYKPDGTYLFSINAKTGYFVGNGRGYADALDY